MSNATNATHPLHPIPPNPTQPNPTHPPIHPPTQPDHFHSYDFVDVWGGTKEETIEKVMAFFESPHFKVRVEWVGGWVGGGWVRWLRVL